MFVVRRAFRNHNKMLTPGSIVEPGEIKWFKTRLRDRLIIEVTEQSLDKWEEYFKEKHKVSIKANLKALKPVADETPTDKAPVDDTKAPDAIKPEEKPKATPVAKAVATVKPKTVKAE